MSPQGRRFDQQDAIASKSDEGIILICGRYEGIDERLVTPMWMRSGRLVTMPAG